MARLEGVASLEAVDLPAVAPWLISCAVASLWISLGTIHRDQHADSILNVLISLQHWTPFVWEQDRFGMLIPLLASPIGNPLANLLFQSTLTTFSGLVTFFLLARYSFRSSWYPVIGTVGAASFLTLSPPYFRFEYLVDTSYGLSLSLAIWGLILLEPGFVGVSKRALAGSVALMLLAHWVNCVTAIFLGPFVVLRWLLGNRPELPPTFPLVGQVSAGRIATESLGRQAEAYPTGPPERIRARIRRWAGVVSRGEMCLALVVLAAGYAAGQAMIALNATQHTDLTALPQTEWSAAWWRLLEAYWTASKPVHWAILIGLEAGIAIVATIVLRRRRRSTRPGHPAWALLATAILLWLMLGTRVWVKMNDYAFRYLFPSALMIQTAVLGAAISSLGVPISSRPRVRRVSTVGSGLVLIAAAAWSYGVPSISGVRRDLDLKFGSLTDDLLAGGCSGLAGDYWRVWPAVFHVNLRLYDEGDRRPFLGFSFRSAPTFGLWNDTPKDRRNIGIATDDGLGDGFLRSWFPGKAREIEVRRTLRVVRPASR